MFAQKSNVNRFCSWELRRGKHNPPQGQRSKFLFPLTVFLFPFCFLLFPSIANALPGQRTEAVAAWINANPTLRPAIGNGLRVTRSSTPAQRFTFQASVLPPGRLTLAKDQGTIRMSG
jgi:hypothetical protein